MSITTLLSQLALVDDSALFSNFVDSAVHLILKNKDHKFVSACSQCLMTLQLQTFEPITIAQPDLVVHQAIHHSNNDARLFFTKLVVNFPPLKMKFLRDIDVYLDYSAALLVLNELLRNEHFSLLAGASRALLKKYQQTYNGEILQLLNLNPQLVLAGSVTTKMYAPVFNSNSNLMAVAEKLVDVDIDFNYFETPSSILELVRPGTTKLDLLAFKLFLKHPEIANSNFFDFMMDRLVHIESTNKRTPVGFYLLRLPIDVLKKLVLKHPKSALFVPTCVENEWVPNLNLFLADTDLRNYCLFMLNSPLGSHQAFTAFSGLKSITPFVPKLRAMITGSEAVQNLFVKFCHQIDWNKHIPLLLQRVVEDKNVDFVLNLLKKLNNNSKFTKTAFDLLSKMESSHERTYLMVIICQNFKFYMMGFDHLNSFNAHIALDISKDQKIISAMPYSFLSVYIESVLSRGGKALSTLRPLFSHKKMQLLDSIVAEYVLNKFEINKESTYAHWLWVLAVEGHSKLAQEYAWTCMDFSQTSLFFMNEGVKKGVLYVPSDKLASEFVLKLFTFYLKNEQNELFTNGMNVLLFLYNNTDIPLYLSYLKQFINFPKDLNKFALFITNLLKIRDLGSHKQEILSILVRLQIDLNADSILKEIALLDNDALVHFEGNTYTGINVKPRCIALARTPRKARQ